MSWIIKFNLLFCIVWLFFISVVVGAPESQSYQSVVNKPHDNIRKIFFEVEWEMKAPARGFQEGTQKNATMDIDFGVGREFSKSFIGLIEFGFSQKFRERNNKENNKKGNKKKCKEGDGRRDEQFHLKKISSRGLYFYKNRWVKLVSVLELGFPYQDFIFGFSPTIRVIPLNLFPESLKTFYRGSVKRKYFKDSRKWQIDNEFGVGFNVVQWLDVGMSQKFIYKHNSENMLKQESSIGEYLSFQFKNDVEFEIGHEYWTSWDESIFRGKQFNFYGMEGSEYYVNLKYDF